MPRTSDRATTQLAFIECARRGWHLEETSWFERFLKDGKLVTIRRDLFGFADGIAFPRKPLPNGVRTIALQWTSTKNVNARIAKIRANPVAPLVRAAGWEIRCWGFGDVLLEREEVAAPV